MRDTSIIRSLLGSLVVLTSVLPATASTTVDGELAAAFRMAKTGFPELGWARFQQLQALYPGLPDREISRLQQWVRSHPADGEALVNLGILQVVTGRAPEAAAVLARASHLQQPDPFAFAYEGFALIESGAPKAAIGPLQTALKLAPSHDFAKWALAQVYYRSGDRREAARLLRDAHAPL